MAKLDAAARQELVDNHHYLVGHLVAGAQKTMSGVSRWVPVEELTGYGWLGLMEAADRFDPDEKAEFATFAFCRIRGAIIDGVRNYCWTSRYVLQQVRTELANTPEPTVRLTSGWRSTVVPRSRRDEDNGGGGGEARPKAIQGMFMSPTRAHCSAFHQEADDDSLEERVDFSRSIEKARVLMKTRPRLEQLVVELVYFKGLSRMAAARELGISVPWAGRLCRSAIAYLSKCLNTNSKLRVPLHSRVRDLAAHAS